MALAIGTPVTVRGISTATVTISSVSVSGSNKYLLAAVSRDSGGDLNPNPTAAYGGQSMTLLAELSGTGQYLCVFGLVDPADGTADVVFSGMSSLDKMGIAVLLTGVDQGTPTGTWDSQQTASNTALPSGTVTCAAGNWILGFIACGADQAGLAVGGGGSIDVRVSPGGQGMDMALAHDADGVDDTMDWTFASDRASAATVEIKAAVAGGDLMALIGEPQCGSSELK